MNEGYLLTISEVDYQVSWTFTKRVIGNTTITDRSFVVEITNVSDNALFVTERNHFSIFLNGVCGWWIAIGLASQIDVAIVIHGSSSDVMVEVDVFWWIWIREGQRWQKIMSKILIKWF